MPAAIQEAQSERARLYAQAVDEAPERTRELETRLSVLRRQITNLTSAIAEAGHSAALLKQLTALETQEAQTKEEYDQLTHLIRSRPSDLSPAAIAQLAAQFGQIWDETTLEEKRDILAAWVHEIRAERLDRQILARIEIYIPPIDGPDPPETNLGLHSQMPWRHLIVGLVYEAPIRYKPRGWHVKKRPA